MGAQGDVFGENFLSSAMIQCGKVEIRRRIGETTQGRPGKGCAGPAIERPLWFAGFRPQTYRVFVDGQMVHEQQGF